MGRKVKTQSSGSMKISLFDPGMTALHRAGLAGLWMTLEAVEQESSLKDAFQSLGSWEKDDTSVILKWKDKKIFEELFNASFKKNSNGLFHFPALSDPGQNPLHAALLQEAILNTVLQHGRTRKADYSNDPKGKLVVQIDDDSTTVQYQRVQEYAHQKPDFEPHKSNKLVGWLYPGGGSRHMGLGKTTDLDNPPGLALALRYFIVGAIYFEIRRLGGGVRPRYAMVIPEINNLPIYAKARKVFLGHGVQRLKASGAAEAALRVLVELEAENVIHDLGAVGCRVFSFGTVPWSNQQKTRVEILDVRPGAGQDLRPFKTAQNFFPIKRIKPEKGDPFWDVPQVPELVARNTVEGRPWWRGFAEFVADKERREHVFRYEKGGLAKMVEDQDVFPKGPERIFVEACHEAWRRRMAQLGERAKREGISFNDLVNREFERWRVIFSRCKNAAAIRAAVIDFWSRGGASLSALQIGWREILPLFDTQDWQKARDLALLALASYRSGGNEEAMSNHNDEGGENG